MDYYNEEDNEYDDYNDYDEEKEDNIEMQGEVNAFERVGIGRRNEFDFIDIDNLDKKNKLKKTPLERFYETVNHICDKLKEKNILAEGDIRLILDNIGNLDKPEYKNATGYILGYIVSRGDKITKQKIFKASDILQDFLEDNSVQIPDIIRYSRLWLNLNKIK